MCGRHNHCALYATDLEAGSGLGRIELLTQPADIVVRGVEALEILTHSKSLLSSKIIDGKSR